MQKYIVLFLFIILHIANPVAAQNTDSGTLAVLNLQAKDVAQKQASIITDIVRSSIVKSGKYTVLDRANMENILKEQSFQQTGCTDTDCAVKIGKLLSMQYMVVGTMSKLGATYILSLEIVSVETGKIVKSEDGSTKSIDDMIEIAKIVAQRVVGIQVALPSSLTSPNSPNSPSSPTTPSTSAVKIGGLYQARGTNPDGSAYSGSVTITREGDLYKFVWKISSSTYLGSGILKGNTLTIDWGSKYPVIYEVQSNGQLKGTWNNGNAFESLTPF